LVLAGSLCAAVALAGALAAHSALKRVPSAPVEDSSDVPLFLLRLALWSGFMFALVIALSLVPTAQLTPSPV
jgi:hypothetical protein